MHLIEKARIFAIAAHSAASHVRKYTGEPYWTHPEHVAATVATVSGVTDHMIAAAWLHDVVEDTGVDTELIVSEFGPDVATLVAWLTDVSTPADGNRAARKAMDRAHIARAPCTVHTIKLADICSNVESIMLHDPVFAKTYMAEKRLMLDVMPHADAVLMARARLVLTP